MVSAVGTALNDITNVLLNATGKGVAVIIDTLINSLQVLAAVYSTLHLFNQSRVVQSPLS